MVTETESNALFANLEKLSAVNAKNLKEIIQCARAEIKDPGCSELLYRDEIKAFFAQIRSIHIRSNDKSSPYFYAQKGVLPEYNTQVRIAEHHNPSMQSLGECNWKISPNDYTDAACATKVQNAQRQLKELRQLKSLADQYDQWLQRINSYSNVEDEDPLIPDQKISGLSANDHAEEV